MATPRISGVRCMDWCSRWYAVRIFSVTFFPSWGCDCAPVFLQIFVNVVCDINIYSYICIVNDINYKDMAKIYDFKALSNKGAEVDFAQFEGKVLMIVNTASKCGFTPQYDGLEALYQSYKDRGLVIVGFPCDQFAHQEPGSNEEIAEFCRINHGVTFPLMAKIEVNGDNAHPIYKYLKSVAKGTFGNAIKWNFTKFLINRDGTVIKRFAPTVTPAKMEKDIQEML